MTTEAPPEKIVVKDGVSYQVQLRATPSHRFGLVMWSADLLIRDGSGLTAKGASPAEALENLEDLIVEQVQPET